MKSWYKMQEHVVPVSNRTMVGSDHSHEVLLPNSIVLICHIPNLLPYVHADRIYLLKVKVKVCIYIPPFLP